MKKYVSSVRMLAMTVLGLVFAGIVLSGCLKNTDDTNNNTNNAAGLMAFNLAPGQSSVGFSISGSNLTALPLAFNNFTGAYLPIFPGSRSVEAYNFGTGNTLATTTSNFEQSKYYSVFLVGSDSTLENLVVRDDFDSLASGSQAFVRYINAIPDPASPTVTIASNGTNVVNENASFKTVSTFLPITPGSVTVSVSNGGTINATRTITLEQQKVYTVLLIGKPGATGDAAVQVKYVTNGQVDNTAGRVNNSAANRSVN